jgi:hypothetical protein
MAESREGSTLCARGRRDAHWSIAYRRYICLSAIYRLLASSGGFGDALLVPKVRFELTRPFGPRMLSRGRSVRGRPRSEHSPTNHAGSRTSQPGSSAPIATGVATTKGIPTLPAELVGGRPSPRSSFDTRSGGTRARSSSLLSVAVNGFVSSAVMPVSPTPINPRRVAVDDCPVEIDTVSG